jgi:hypothetical protein
MKPLLSQAKPLRLSLLRNAPAISECPPISTDFFGVDPLLQRLRRYGHTNDEGDGLIPSAIRRPLGDGTKKDFRGAAKIQIGAK